MTASVARQFLAFGLAGIAGFLVDAAVLLLLRPWLGLYWGRAGSFLAAAFVTWLINRRLAFAGRRPAVPRGAEFASYLVLMTVGALANYGVYAALLVRFPALTRAPVLAVAAGSLAGMLLNFAAARHLLYRRRADVDRVAGPRLERGDPREPQ